MLSAELVRGTARGLLLLAGEVMLKVKWRLRLAV